MKIDQTGTGYHSQVVSQTRWSGMKRQKPQSNYDNNRGE